MMTLREIARSGAFDAIRDFEDAARFHVWHQRLGIGRPVDLAAAEALQRGRGFAVVGPTGSGKTSTLAAAALGTDGMHVSHIPLQLSVSGASSADNANDPRYFAARLVRDVAGLSRQVENMTEAAATTGTAVGAVNTWRATIGVKSTKLAKEIRQRTENVDFERTPNEVIAVAVKTLRSLRGEGLRPVVLLEDADGLLRTPGRDPAQRRDEASAFFADALFPLLRELDAPALIAAQEEYEHLDGFERVRMLLDDVQSAPNPASVGTGGVRLLLDEALTHARVDRRADRVFTAEALGVVVANRYSIRTFRALLQVCDQALKHAIGERTSQIEEASVGYAISVIASR